MEAAFERQPFRDAFNREVVLLRAIERDAPAALEHFRRLAARIGGDYRAVPDLPPAPASLSDALHAIAHWSKGDTDVAFLVSLAAAYDSVSLPYHANQYYSLALAALGTPRWGDTEQLETLTCIKSRRAACNVTEQE